MSISICDVSVAEELEKLLLPFKNKPCTKETKAEITDVIEKYMEARIAEGDTRETFQNL